MNNTFNLAALITVFVLFTSCEQPNINTDNGVIDEEERAVIEECRANFFTSKSDIENNLIGEWELIGHGNSIFLDETEPKINLKISDTDLIMEFQNEHVEQIDTMPWEIEEVGSSNSQYFRLKTTPEHVALRISTFCEQYMYLEISPIVADPGRMYLYEKVN